MSDARRLPADLTIYAVRDGAEQGLRWLSQLDAEAGDAPLQVAAHGVEEVDAAGVQLLIALSRSLAARGRRLQLLQPSPVLQRALACLGAAPLLGDASPAGSAPSTDTPTAAPETAA